MRSQWRFHDCIEVVVNKVIVFLVIGFLSLRTPFVVVILIVWSIFVC